MTASNLGKEVNVWTIFAQGKETFELKQETENGTFYMQTPKIYGEYLLYLSAADLNKDENYIIQRRQQGLHRRESLAGLLRQTGPLPPAFRPSL